MTAEDRLGQLNETLAAIGPAWPHIARFLKQRAEEMTESLISADNEQTRGRIKQLRELLNLPETLQQERDGIQRGLADEAPQL